MRKPPADQLAARTPEPDATDAEPVPAGRSPAEDLKEVRFDLLRSALYHDMRQTTLVQAHRILLFVTVLAGSAAIAAFGPDYPVVARFSGLAVAIITAAQLVWDFGGAAHQHADLRRRFYALLAEAEGNPDLPRLRAAMTLIYADEPPLRLRVNKRAHNQAGKSIYGDDFERA
ncbi:MAG: hypothetical protein VX874_15735 [Pseudomonadota bacterium]|nr:hypothetical protein [Pseudomonadota bacterium]